MPLNDVSVALGANLGDRLSQLQEARDAFKKHCAHGDAWAQSSIYHTQSVNCPEGSPDYLNSVINFNYEGTAEELLLFCKTLEVQMGRAVDGSSGEINLPRMIDADILYFGTQVINLPHLIVPHPRMRERRFVLEPLVEIKGDLRLPHNSETIRELLDGLPSEEEIVKYSENW